MTLKPTEFEDGDPLCPHCVVAKLTPMAGRSFGSKATFLWWRCEVCGGITEAVALPRGRRIRI